MLETRFQVEFEPLGIRASCAEDSTLLAAAQRAGVGLNSICGGNATCRSCQVRVVSGRVSPVCQTEREALGEEQVAQGMRLACLVRVLGDGGMSRSKSLHVPAW
jgi:CDP-4-dehydro-6-deoxyglucose reductase